MNDKPVFSLYEQQVLTSRDLCHLNGWRHFRIEYCHGGACPEGNIWLPSNVEPEAIETLLNNVIEELEISAKLDQAFEALGDASIG